MRMLVITNRNIVENATGASLFGEKVNDKGPCELRLAWADKDGNDDWKVCLIPEKHQDSPDDPASKHALKEYFEELKEREKACVLYIHGFNKNFRESLEQAHNISETYQVGVVAFSWPSYPGGLIDGYYIGKAIASNSVVALDRTLETFCSVIHSVKVQEPDYVRGLSINLLIHSLGNYMFEKFIRDPIFSTETRVFDNIVLNAADVDLKGHERWTNKLKYAKRVYATINEEDWVLDWSLWGNSHRKRLGNSDRRFVSKRLIYFDLSGGKDVGNCHEHFGETAKANPVVEAFFTRVLCGKEGLPLANTTYESSKNAYVLDEKEEPKEENHIA